MKIYHGIIELRHPIDPRQNGIAERAVRRIKEWTSAVLLESSLNEKWWVDSMECYCYMRNVLDLLADGNTPCDWRFGEQFKGPVIPFDSKVENHLISAKDQSTLHQFGKTVLPGVSILRFCINRENREI